VLKQSIVYGHLGKSHKYLNFKAMLAIFVRNAKSMRTSTFRVRRETSHITYCISGPGALGVMFTLRGISFAANCHQRDENMLTVESYLECVSSIFHLIVQADGEHRHTLATVSTVSLIANNSVAHMTRGKLRSVLNGKANI
jgi:hypothetical protein